MQRRCRMCGVEKDLSEFKKFKDRIFHQCVQCCVARQKQKRLSNPEAFNKRRRELYERNQGRILLEVKKYRASNPASLKTSRAKYETQRDPVKQSARNIPKNAVKSGKVSKPAHCQVCASTTPKRQLQGHHADYSKPLAVTWMCNFCHATHHRKERNSNVVNQ